MSLRPLDIVLVGPARFSVAPPFAGGLESFVGTLAAGLRCRGHRVRVVAGSRQATNASRADLPTDEEDAATDGRSLRDAVAATLAERRADVVHCNSASAEILDLMDAGTTWELTLHTPPLTDQVSRIAELDALALSTPSTTNAQRWQQWGVHADVVPNGVDRRLFSPRRRAERYLAWAGRLVPEKGAHLAIEAARVLEMPLRLAGPAHDADYFAQQIASKLGPRITYEGHLAPEGLASLMSGASATLVTPLWPEPFGLVVAESLACGTPVAAIANGSLAPGGSFPSHVVRLAESATPAGLARATLDAIEVSRAECRSASASFDLGRMVERYERRYRRVDAALDTGSRSPANGTRSSERPTALEPTSSAARAI